MGFLSSLFDPIGAVATGGNNNTFSSLFNQSEDLFGNNGLGVEPNWLSNTNNDFGSSVDNTVDNVVDANLDELRNLGNHFGKNPAQLFYSGADPLSTKAWNAATNQNNTPFLNTFGGETNQDFANSQARGINTQDHQYLSLLANAVAGAYGGSELGDLAGAAYGGATAGAGAEGSMGSSALDVQAELANSAAAGSGSSAAGADAAQIPGWAAGSGAGGATAGHAVSGATRGAAQGAASGLNSDTNPWKAAGVGGLTGGIGSGLDYAGSVGIDNPYAKTAINGGINGGVRAGMQDTSKTGYGALVGALGGLVNTGTNSAVDYLSSPSSGDGGTSTGTTNWGNLATGLGNLYMASRNNAGIQGQINNLNGLYQPGGAYATQMQQQLDRQDAAGGRRSQYGTRAVELQGRLADAATRNAPTLANLYAQQRQNRFNQLAGLVAMGKNSGAFNGLGGMFGSNQPQQSVSPYTPGTQMTQIDPSTMNQDYNNILPGPITDDQIYGG